MRHWVHNPLWEAARLLSPLKVLGWGWMDLEHCLSGGTLLSCRRPDFRDAWPHVASSPDGDAWSLRQPHCGKQQSALSHVCRAEKWSQASPHCLGGGREALVFPCASWIVTGNASRAYPFEVPHLCQPWLIWPMTGCHPLCLSPWEQVCWSEWQESLQQESEQQEPEWQESPWQEPP